MEGKWGGQQSKKLGYNECRQIYSVTLNSLLYLWKLYLYHQVLLIDPSEKRKKEKKKKKLILIHSTSKEVRIFIQKFSSYDHILFEQYNLLYKEIWQLLCICSSRQNIRFYFLIYKNDKLHMHPTVLNPPTNFLIFLK